MFKKLLIASAALAALAFPSGAGAYVNAQGQEVCPGQTFEQSFKQFGDKSHYTLVPNGSFESGLFGWDVSGDATVIPYVNEFLPEGSANALYMPAGSSVTSPPICVSKGYPYARAFAQRLSGDGSAALKVEVLYPAPTTSRAGNPNPGGSPHGGGSTGGQGARPVVKPAGFIRGTTAFRPTRRFSIGQGRIGRGTTTVRFRFTVRGDASYILDDLLVDPHCRR
jgi:hypothetical protein